MKHFYLNVFFPFNFLARDLVNAAIDLFYPERKRIKAIQIIRSMSDRVQEKINSQEKPNGINVIKCSANTGLAQVLKMEVVDYKGLNYSLFGEEILRRKSSNSRNGRRMNHLFYLKNSLTS